MHDSVWKVPALHESAAIMLGRFKGCSTLTPDGALFPITADTTRECFATLISWRNLRCVLGRRHLVKTAPIYNADFYLATVYVTAILSDRLCVCHSLVF